MTPQERAKPELIKASRKRRIAAGAGVPVQEVNRLLNQFEQMQKMMKMMREGRHREDDAGDEGRCSRRCGSTRLSPRQAGRRTEVSLANRSLARVESRPFRASRTSIPW